MAGAEVSGEEKSLKVLDFDLYLNVLAVTSCGVLDESSLGLNS